MKYVSPLLALFLILMFLISCQPAETGDVIFSNVHVIDVENGKVIEHQDVIIEGNQIKKIRNHVTSNLQTDRLVDGTDKYLIPGLWDMHVHIHEYSDIFLPLFLAHGVTGIRDLHNMSIDDFNAWKAHARTQSFAPRIGPVAGKIVDGDSTWARPIVVKTEAEARAAVAQVINMGGDYIKIYSGMPRKLIEAIIDEANQRNIPFAGHYVWGMDLAEQSDLGFRSIEHLEISLSYAKNSEELLEKYTSIVENGTTNDHMMEFFTDINEAHKNRDDAKMTRLFQKLKENQTWQCTAVLALLWVDALDFNDITEEDLGLQYYPDSLAKKFMAEGRNKSEAYKTFGAESLEINMDIVKKLYDHGVPILAGGHPSPIRALAPGVSLYRELLLMQEAGIPATEVLKTATINPAIFMEREEELGTIEEEKLADLVLLEANPLEDIKNTKTILGVMKDGKYYDRVYLDSVLLQLETQAAQ